MRRTIFREVQTSHGHSRSGVLKIAGREYQTPILFPVACLMTGTTARGGGLWKYILHADQNHGLLQKNTPILSQVLHFLDFGLSANALQQWQEVGILHRYNTEPVLNLQTHSPLFLDSGGFKLLWNDTIDLRKYNLDVHHDEGWRTILELQRAFGGDIVASLDYPIPPNLAQNEAQERMQRSLANAVAAVQYLSQTPTYQPVFFAAVHGQNREDIRQYVQTLFSTLQNEGLGRYPIGLAIGSLVPLRSSKNYPLIVDLVRGVQEGIPENRRNRIPIHTFGVTGNLIPLLSYLGVDSFDSSTYIKEASNLKYRVPNGGQTQPILEMEKLPCHCQICRNINLQELQNSLMSPIRNRPLENGFYKSKFYGDIALHNLNIDFDILFDTKEAIKADYLISFLMRHLHRHPSLHDAVSYLAQEDEVLNSRLTTRTIPVRGAIPQRTISLQYTPNSFNILSNGYCPPEDKNILLIIPCSSEKPYTDSRTHKFITTKIIQTFNGQSHRIHKVTLSGLYGPVPEEYEMAREVLGYDYHLDESNQSQMNLLITRMKEYIERHQDHYDVCIAYATSSSYRRVLERVAREQANMAVIPETLRNRKLTEFFRAIHVDELLEKIRENINVTE